MYKYIPKHDLKKQMLKAKKKPYSRRMNCTPEFLLARQLFGDYYSHVDIWLATQYYSPVRLTHVPVNGILFDVKFFDEVITDEP